MDKQTQAIIKSFEDTLSGQPWFGRAVYEILGEADESKVHTKPNGTEHSMIDLLWHMNTWAEFALGSLEKRSADEMNAIEANDWREIDPKTHTWKKGLEQLKATHNKILEILKQKTDDSFLGDVVPLRKFNFRYMLNGLIQHNIYHLGQVAYVKKILS
ncbi:MAG TPA: DinB family protein [Chitinophagaceae bacterium]|nr:DinB family protein [Chitinophagaceae bacterium]